MHGGLHSPRASVTKHNQHVDIFGGHQLMEDYIMLVIIWIITKG